MGSTSWIKNLQKIEKYSFQTSRTFAFELKVASKSFFRKVPIINFEFKWPLRLFLAFPESGFSFVIQKLRKNWKMTVWNAQNICFWGQGSFESIFYNASYDQILIYTVFDVLTHFPRKWFQFRQSKIYKKLKNALLKGSRNCFWPQSSFKTFPKKLPVTKFEFKSIQSSVLLSQKTVSTSSLKNMQKTEKWPFRTLRAFVGKLKVASKAFSKKLSMTKFWFNQVIMFCLPFPENGFNFLNQKYAKNWKVFSNAQKIRFRAGGSFKTIFKEACYDQILI